MTAGRHSIERVWVQMSMTHTDTPVSVSLSENAQLCGKCVQMCTNVLYSAPVAGTEGACSWKPRDVVVCFTQSIPLPLITLERNPVT